MIIRVNLSIQVIPDYSCVMPVSQVLIQDGVKHLKRKKNFMPLFMDGVQLPQGLNHFEEAVYLLPLSSQKFLVLILLTLEGWKAESTLELPSGFKHWNPWIGNPAPKPLGHCSISRTDLFLKAVKGPRLFAAFA